MTFHATLTQLAAITNASLHCCDLDCQSAPVQGITTDSREVEPGNLFVALRGDRFDGHEFVAQVKDKGAIAALVDHPVSVELPQIVVKDTLTAYQQLGRWWRDQFQIPVIAITGSVGKTTTKELIAAVLGTAGRVCKTEANNNNEIGVPKTLLGLAHDHDFAVIEMGMRGRGEIAQLAQIARPTIAVITNVGTAHIGRLGSREAIAEAKCELLAELPAASIAILNADSPLLIQTAQKVWSGTTITYGLTTGDLRGTLVDDQTLELVGIQYPLPLPGEHNALNYLAAIAIARHLNLDQAPLRTGLCVNLPSGRAQRRPLANDVVLLDETYNAGVESMEAALKLLAQTPGQRRIAVLGAMKELGDHAPELHRQVGQRVQDLGLDLLLILGTGCEGTALASGTTTVPTQQFATHDALVDYLMTEIQPGDRLLFKASHSVGLDRVVAALEQRWSPAPAVTAS
ncbi:UDP-N-acetylmuramoyl-tripeptide--D-alanyl-D-alanine ligase [Synechococcales cyanobacterium C]|uniref:UDP-N-acetylmuramoyl-tripeptide--D-alanyl-D-alanine ligase n=2 Tax=Petrachloros TaxID=2918834 RepID=A0A8K1ZWZ7_9CYAN|nr:UDP-N-acetylmuramoyl-tripeptide--D-alanyl-D-alanine ligase [Petrachloros mirabilis ULC683]